MRAKAKGSDQRRGTDASESENTEDEEAREQAKTFGMSVGQKRAFENAKRLEKEFMTRFTVLFVKIVASHMIDESRIMKVIDMTNIDALSSNTTLSLSKSPRRSSPNKNAIKMELDFD